MINYRPLSHRRHRYVLSKIRRGHLYIIVHAVISRACGNGGRSLDWKLLRLGFLVLAFTFTFALSLLTFA